MDFIYEANVLDHDMIKTNDWKRKQRQAAK